MGKGNIRTMYRLALLIRGFRTHKFNPTWVRRASLYQKNLLVACVSVDGWRFHTTSLNLRRPIGFSLHWKYIWKYWKYIFQCTGKERMCAASLHFKTPLHIATGHFQLHPEVLWWPSFMDLMTFRFLSLWGVQEHTHMHTHIPRANPMSDVLPERMRWTCNILRWTETLHNSGLVFWPLECNCNWKHSH